MNDKKSTAAANRFVRLKSKRDNHGYYNPTTGFSLDINAYLDFAAAADEAWQHYEHFRHLASIAVIQTLPSHLADLVKTDIDAAYRTAKAERDEAHKNFIRNSDADAHFEAIAHYRFNLSAQAH
jgi:hypothetical protein